MTQGEIAEHAGYLGDQVKLAAYDAALRHVVGPESTVLDLGAGTGILGLLAARAGARHVYSVDTGAIIATAEAVARASGLADRMTFLRGLSTELDLPEKVDVVVCDQTGGLVYDAGAFEYLADASRRLLRPGGALVPGSFRLLIAPVESRLWAEQVGVWASRPAGFDFAPMAELAANTELRIELSDDEILGPPSEWAVADADHDGPIRGSVEIEIGSDGTFNGLAGMFVATLAPGIELTNCPGRAGFFRRWQNLYPLAAPVPVGAGDRVAVTFDVRPRTYLATWRVDVHRSGGPAWAGLGSTALGAFVTPAELRRTRGDAVPRRTGGIAADVFILDLADGRRTLSEIVELAWEAHGGAYASRAELRARCDQLLRRYVPTP